jgi:nicotinate-nucleotide adenylyltransferase
MGGGGARLGIFGGTFDPPHVGHIRAASEVRSALDLDEVLLVVANDPWQKVDIRRITDARHRLAMVEAAIEGHEGLRSSSIEIERGGPSFMVDTLEELAEALPGSELLLIVGADAAAGLPTWYRYGDLAGLATLVIVDRPGTDHAIIPAHWPASEPIERVMMTPTEISSSELRDRLRSDAPVAGLLADPVLAYIRRHGLYRVGAHE